MRKPLVAGNWKMHGSQKEAHALITAIQEGAKAFAQTEIAIFPSFIHLPLASNVLSGSPLAWGAQNLYLGTQGAFTGEISGSMLADLQCRYVLIGHSERRTLFHEDLVLVAAKFKAALSANLKPVLCVGETLAEREVNRTEARVQEQIESVIDVAGISAFQNAVIAYEPIWAIGTGLTASPEEAQNVHAFIRKLLAKYDLTLANTLSILYGGSVKADNARGLFNMPDIDGALVGGASLDANQFLSICRSAHESHAALV